MKNSYLTHLRKRRSIYCLGKNISQSKSQMAELINQAAKLSPSAFNSQSTRVVVLFNEHHLKLWSLVKEALDHILTPNDFDKSVSKIDACFASGVGTVLFFEDSSVIEELRYAHPLYADNFKVWSEQAAGMVQLSVWTALASENIGASLQHYNPIIDEAVLKEWDIPKSWELTAQLPFGSIEDAPDEKTFIADEVRFKVIK